MKIVRDGKEFELTEEELLRAREEHEYMRDFENIKGTMEYFLIESDFEKFKDDDEFILEAAKLLREFLNQGTPFYEAIPNVFEVMIYERREQNQAIENVKSYMEGFLEKEEFEKLINNKKFVERTASLLRAKLNDGILLDFALSEAFDENYETIKYPYLSKCSDFHLLKNAFDLDTLNATEESIRLYEETDLLVFDEERGVLYHREGKDFFKAAVVWYLGFRNIEKFISDFGEKNKVSLKSEKSYFDVHITHGPADGDGYSIFVELDGLAGEQDALDKVRDEHLYQEPEDLYNIDYIEEIDKKTYFQSTGKATDVPFLENVPKKQPYRIAITETYVKEVEVYANDPVSAEQMAVDLCWNGVINLDYDNNFLDRVTKCRGIARSIDLELHDVYGNPFDFNDFKPNDIVHLSIYDGPDGEVIVRSVKDTEMTVEWIYGTSCYSCQSDPTGIEVLTIKDIDYIHTLKLLKREDINEIKDKKIYLNEIISGVSQQMNKNKEVEFYNPHETTKKEEQKQCDKGMSL